MYSGTCGTLVCVGGDDDGCGSGGGASTLTFNATLNTTYYIFVTGYGGAAGDFTLSVSCVNGPDVNSFTPAMSPTGTSVVITGSGFTGASAVSFNGTAATYTVNSATQITATVPAAATSGPISVVAGGITGTSAASFTVLSVFGGTVNQCLSATPVSSTGTGNWQWLLAPNGQIVAAFNDQGYALGRVSVDFDLNQGAVRADGGGREYLDRNWHLIAQNPFVGRSVLVRFYATNSEFASYVAANDGDGNDATALTQLRLSQYQGPNEDCLLANNSGTDRRLLTPAAPIAPGGMSWFALEANVPDHFSEFYVTGGSQPLPVELTDFTARRAGSAVLAQWRTAQEINSQGFRLERSMDGQHFADVSGLLPGAGSSSSAHTYAFPDEAAPAGALYYRLRQEDTNGSSSYSAVVSVAAVGAPLMALSCYPQPAHGTASVAGATAGTPVVLYDTLGRQLTAITAEANGRATLVLPMGLAAGVYVVRCGQQATRLVVE